MSVEAPVHPITQKPMVACIICNHFSGTAAVGDPVCLSCYMHVPNANLYVKLQKEREQCWERIENPHPDDPFGRDYWIGRMDGLIVAQNRIQEDVGV